ncbi:sugar transferase [Planctomycetota bacterium]
MHGLDGDRVRRALDVWVSASVLAASAPLIGGIALAVKVDSPGPVFFGHQRVGRGWRPFRVWKFRTMVDGADKRGPTITADGDCRVTRVGRILRATKLDELPQLWNVLTGEMSLVGPRPEVAKYAELFRSDYEEILKVRPGLTDPATLMYRSEEALLGQAVDVEEMYAAEVLPCKIELSKAYLRKRGLRTDLSILVRTLVRIVAP